MSKNNLAVFLLSTIVITCLAMVMAITLYLSDRPFASWHMVDVNFGKLTGDANLIVINDTVIMIDAGYKKEAEVSLVPYLRELKIRKIDHFFVSHPHRDHYEGIAALWDDNIRIENLYVNIPPKEICDREIPWGCNYRHVQNFIDTSKELGINVIHPETGFTLELPQNSKLKVIHAQKTDLPNTKIDVNDLSLIMKWHISGSTVLFTGDLNKSLGTYLSSDMRMESDFLKMPHHGGKGIAPNTFFDMVSPKYTLIPGPKWIWCGERADQPRNWTLDKNIPYWVNGLHGTIRVEFTKNGGKIYREKNDSCAERKSNANILDNPFLF